MNTPKKLSTHFFFHEFFSRGIWQSNSESTLRKLLDPRLVPIMESLRKDLGRPIFINNWKWGGNSSYRGFRPQQVSVGARYSQHKFGRAVDFQVKGKTANSVRKFILDRESKYLKMGLTRLESGKDAKTWVHLDLAWTGLDNIYVFRA